MYSYEILISVAYYYHYYACDLVVDISILAKYTMFFNLKDYRAEDQFWVFALAHIFNDRVL